MLNHTIMGPTAAGEYLVTYPTPGCNVPTVASICKTPGQAEQDAKRLNGEQLMREMAIRRDRELRGLRGVYPALEFC